MEKHLLVFSYEIHAGMSSVLTVLFFLLVAPEVWTPSGGLLTLAHSGVPSGLLAHLAVLQKVLFFREHFFIICGERIYASSYSLSLYSFSDMTVVWSGSPAGDIYPMDHLLCF